MTDNDTLRDYEKAAIILREKVLTLYTMHAVPIPSRKGGSDWDKKALHFDCTVKHTATGRVHECQYSVGSAIPILWAKKDPEAFIRQLGMKRIGFNVRDVQNLKTDRHTIYENELVCIIRASYRPDVSDVLASLLMDTDGFELGMTLREWWDATGSDTMGESPVPDVLDAYQAIESAARFLARTAGAELEGMRELAQEL